MSNTRPACVAVAVFWPSFHAACSSDRARRRDLRGLRLDLLAAARQGGDRELALQLPHARGIRRLRRAGVVELLPRDAADRELRLVARELRGGALLVRLRLRELRARDVLLLRPLALPHVGELRLGRPQMLLRLALRRGAVDRFEHEEPRADGDVVAALDEQLVEPPARRRSRR